MSANPNIAGDPAPTKPSARQSLIDYAAETRTVTADGLAPLLDAYRAEVLAEAVDAARGEYLLDGSGTDDDKAYDQGVTDTIAAIGALLEAGESRG